MRRRRRGRVSGKDIGRARGRCRKGNGERPKLPEDVRPSGLRACRKVSDRRRSRRFSASVPVSASRRRAAARRREHAAAGETRNGRAVRGVCRWSRHRGGPRGRSQQHKLGKRPRSGHRPARRSRFESAASCGPTRGAARRPGGGGRRHRPPHTAPSSRPISASSTRGSWRRPHRPVSTRATLGGPGRGERGRAEGGNPTTSAAWPTSGAQRSIGDFWVAVAQAQSADSDMLTTTAAREPALLGLVSEMSQLYDRSSRRALWPLRRRRHRGGEAVPDRGRARGAIR